MASIFIQKLNKFLGHAWQNPEEIAIVNDIISNREEIRNDPSSGPGYIQNYIQQNQDIIQQTSDEFQDMITELPGLLAEADYTGAWDTTAVKIDSISGMSISVDNFVKIKKILKKQFNLDCKPKVKGVIEKDADPIITSINVQAVPNKLLVPIHKAMRKINPDLAANPTVLPGVSHNIASDLNAANRDKEEKQSQETVFNVWESKNKKMSKAKEPKLDKSNKTKTQDETFSPYDDENYSEHRQNGFDDRIEDFDIDSILAESLKENDSSDISVMDQMVGKKRVEDFDPYKNIANTDGKSKTQIKMDADVLQESLKGVDLEKVYVIGDDLNEAKEHSKLTIEADGHKQTLKINRQDFMEFIVKKVNVNGYINEGTFDMPKYFKSRTRGFINTLVQEYFKSVMNESAMNTLAVTNIIVTDADVHIYYDEDETFTAPLEDFSNFIERFDKSFDNFYSDGYGYTHDWESYWNSKSDEDKKAIASGYLKYKNVKPDAIEESKQLKETYERPVFDYSEWKDMVATKTSGNYEVKRAGDNTLKTIAVNATNKLIGEWDPNEGKGVIYNK